MYYYREIKLKNGFILSCDMLRITFKLTPEGVTDMFTFFNNLNLIDSKYEFKHFYNISPFKYRNLFNFTNKDIGASFVVGLGFNGSDHLEKLSCFIEFNPNKCFVNNYVVPVLKRILTTAKYYEISRWDFALDMPFKRSCVCLLKDLRHYSKYVIDVGANTLENITEYLGCRNSNGFVKLYNKKIEQKLDYDLTRLEITLDSLNYSNFNKQFPEIYTYADNNFLTYNTLNDTDKVLLLLLRNDINNNIYLKMLGRKKTLKLKNLLFDKQILVSEYDFNTLVKVVKEIISLESYIEY